MGWWWCRGGGGGGGGWGGGGAWGGEGGEGIQGRCTLFQNLEITLLIISVKSPFYCFFCRTLFG